MHSSRPSESPPLALLDGDIALRWFEEPTRWHADWRGLRDVRMRGNVNVAAGQSEISRVGMREMCCGRF